MSFAILRVALLSRTSGRRTLTTWGPTSSPCWRAARTPSSAAWWGSTLWRPSAGPCCGRISEPLWLSGRPATDTPTKKRVRLCRAWNPRKLIHEWPRANKKRGFPRPTCILSTDRSMHLFNKWYWSLTYLLTSLLCLLWFCFSHNHSVCELALTVAHILLSQIVRIFFCCLHYVVDVTKLRLSLTTSVFPPFKTTLHKLLRKLSVLCSYTIQYFIQ